MRNDADWWTPNRRKFAVWSALPEDERVPFTQERFGAELHVSEDSLTRWKQEPQFQAEVKRLVTASLGPEYPNIMGAFIKKARAGDVTAIKTAFEMLRVYIPMQGNLSGDEVEQWLNGLSPADIDREIMGIVDAARAGKAARTDAGEEASVGRGRERTRKAEAVTAGPSEA